MSKKPLRILSETCDVKCSPHMISLTFGNIIPTTTPSGKEAETSSNDVVVYMKPSEAKLLLGFLNSMFGKYGDIWEKYIPIEKEFRAREKEIRGTSIGYV